MLNFVKTMKIPPWTTLLIGGIPSLWIGSFFLGFSWCSEPQHYANYSHYLSCYNLVRGLGSAFILQAPLFFLIALFTIAESGQIYRTWSIFAVPWFVTTSFIIFLTPEHGDIHSPDWNGITSLSLTALFFLISVFIIVRESRRVKK